MVGHSDEFGLGDQFGGNTILSGSQRSNSGIGSAGTSPFARDRERLDTARAHSFSPSGLSSIGTVPDPLANFNTAALAQNFPSVETVAANFSLIPRPTRSAVPRGGLAPSAGPTLFTTNEALGPLAQSGPTFFGTPIFPPNGGFAPSDDFSPATLLAFAEAGRKRRASEAAARTPVAPVTPRAPVAVAPPGVPVPPAQAASAAQQAIAQQNNALVATLAQQITARNAAPKTSSLPPLPVLKTPGEIKVAATGAPVEAPAPAGKNTALGELIPTADGAFLTPVGPRSWKLPNSGSRVLENGKTIDRILRNIDFAFEKATGGVGRIVRQAGKGVGEAFEGKVGIGPETWRALVKAGIFRSNNTDLMSGVQAFNEVLLEGGAIAGGLALRTLQAVENAGVEAVVQFAREAGETETGARKLKRDLRGLALIAGIVSGRNAGAFRRGGHGRRSVKPRESRARRQLGEGLIAKAVELPKNSNIELGGEFRRRIVNEIQELKSTGRMTQIEIDRWEELHGVLKALDGGLGEAKGAVGEEVLFRLLERIGVNANKPKSGGKGDIKVFDVTGKEIAKFDQVIEGEIRAILGFFIVRKNKNSVALIDAKTDRIGSTKGQSRALTELMESRGLTVKLKDSHGKTREVPVKTIDWFRTPLDRAPRDLIVEKYRSVLGNLRYKGKPIFSDEVLDEIQQDIITWHKMAVARRRAGKAVGGVLTIGGLALMLGFLTETKVQAQIRQRRTPSAPIK